MSTVTETGQRGCTEQTTSSPAVTLSEEMAASKQLVRLQVKQILEKLSVDVQKTKSVSVVNKVIADSSYQQSERIAVYLSMPGEVDTTPLIQRMLSDNKKCFIPRYHMKSRQMEMLQLYSMDDMYNLPKTKWNIPQPALDDESRDDAMKTGGLDMVIVPGLAFTAGGKRLGRGKGYYDTFLNNHKSLLDRCPVTLALAFSEQVLDDVPTSEFDYLIDLVFKD